MIPKNFIQDLLNRLDIVDVVEHYVPLKKAGANFVACCPFHQEKSPSFTVSQSRQFYHCFGCGAHGNAITFIMEHSGQGYVEAIETLAERLGVPVPREQSSTPTAQKIAPDLYELMQTATRYYRQQLKASPRAIEYLKNRELTGEIAAKFALGYAPEGWQPLAAAFPQYQDPNLGEVGLVICNEQGRHYDRFRDRIMFPIINLRGQVIGFGGRVLDKGEPKYLNSPETPLFEKGRELYGLFQAQKTIREREQVLVVEGYMDVVALAQHGVNYAVATLGTATTPHHIQKLLRLTPHIIFCFDGDRAGQKAAWRALENALPHLQDGKRLSFLFLPVEHDPDSYIRTFGQAAFENKLDDALPLSTYLLRQISFELDLRTSEGRSQLLQRAKPLLAAITAPTTALLLRKEVAALAGISQAELEALFEITPVARAAQPALQKRARTAPSALRLLLQCLLAQPSLAARMPADWHETSPEADTVLAVLAALREANFNLSGVALTQLFQGTSHEKLLNQAQTDLLDWGDSFDIEGEFDGLLNKLASHQRRHQFEQLQEKLSRVGMANLSEPERQLYLQLLQRRKTPIE